MKTINKTELLISIFIPTLVLSVVYFVLGHFCLMFLSGLSQRNYSLEDTLLLTIISRLHLHQYELQFCFR